MSDDEMKDGEVKPRNKGGRPKKVIHVDPKETPEAKRLASLLAATELESIEANTALAAEPTIANKVRWLAAEMRAATLRRAWCMLDGNHAHALRWAEIAAKLSREHAATSELGAIDEVRELAKKAAAEDRVSRRLGGGT